MKSKLLLVAATSALLVSCGNLEAANKEIQFEEATKVAENISKKLDSESYKAPTKVTAEIKRTSSGETIEMKAVIDETAKYLYVSEAMYEEKTLDTKVELWSYFEGKSFTVAGVMTQEGETEKQYYTSDTPADPSQLGMEEMGISEFVDISKTMSSAMAESSKESMNESTEKSTFKSSGEGNLIIEAIGKNGEYAYMEFKNNLIVSLNEKFGEYEETMTFKWGEAKISKPNLSGFQKVEREIL